MNSCIVDTAIWISLLLFYRRSWQVSSSMRCYWYRGGRRTIGAGFCPHTSSRRRFHCGCGLGNYFIVRVIVPRAWLAFLVRLLLTCTHSTLSTWYMPSHFIISYVLCVLLVLLRRPTTRRRYGMCVIFFWYYLVLYDIYYSAADVGPRHALGHRARWAATYSCLAVMPWLFLLAGDCRSSTTIYDDSTIVIYWYSASHLLRHNQLLISTISAFGHDVTRFWRMMMMICSSSGRQPSNTALFFHVTICWLRWWHDMLDDFECNTMDSIATCNTVTPSFSWFDSIALGSLLVIVSAMMLIIFTSAQIVSSPIRAHTMPHRPRRPPTSSFF